MRRFYKKIDTCQCNCIGVVSELADTLDEAKTKLKSRYLIKQQRAAADTR
jgi:hypothetical protein